MRCGVILFCAFLAGPCAARSPIGGEEAEARPRRPLSGCRCGDDRLELVFVLDATGSMALIINTVKEQAAKMILVLREHVADLRVGVVAYRTPDDPEYCVKRLPLTSDLEAAIAFIRTIQAKAGGEEAVERGLGEAVDRMGWTKGADKIVILVGDEENRIVDRETLYQQARRAQARGLVVHTITASESAFRYYQHERPKEAEALLAEQGDKIRQNFRLPSFVKVAELAGGVAASSANVRDLVKWLIAFSLGLGEEGAEKLQVDRFFAWSRQEDPASRSRSPLPPDGERKPWPPLIGELRDAGPFPAHHHYQALFAHLRRHLVWQREPEARPVRLEEAELGDVPLLYLSLHRPMKFSAAELVALRQYLERGGFLFADCCCGSPEFDRFFHALVEKHLKGFELRQLPPAHPVFTIGGDWRRVRVRRQAVGYEKGPPELWGIFRQGPAKSDSSGKALPPLVGVYSPQDLGCGWHRSPLSPPCRLHPDDALGLSGNILLYALSP